MFSFFKNVVYVQLSPELLTVHSPKTGKSISERPEVAISAGPKERIVAVGSETRTVLVDQEVNVVNPFAHPSMKKVIRSAGENGEKPDADSDDDDGDTSREHVTYDHELDDGQDGTKAGGLKTKDTFSKQSDFDRSITVEKLLIKVDRPGGVQTNETVPATGPRSEMRKTIKVSSGEQSLSAKLPPLEFKLLTPAAWDCIGELEALAGTVRHMANRLPWVRFAMSLCQLKAGRVFSMVNRKPRVALVVTIMPPDNPPIVLLDVDRTGDVALSIVALHFHRYSSFDVVEASVKRALDGLVDGSGHWDHEIEREFTDICGCERLPKMLTPRSDANTRGQTALWAMKLLRRLGLEVVPSDSELG